jgi:hypothetical protein
LNSNIFSDSQAYIGLSKATTIKKVFFSILDFDTLKADPEAIEEYKGLETKASKQEYRITVSNCRGN